jgi:hypothetical protein
MNIKTKFYILAILIVFAAISAGCVEKDGQNISDNSTQSDNGINQKEQVIEYEVENVWITLGIHESNDLRVIVNYYNISNTKKQEFRIFELSMSQIYDDTSRKMICVQVQEDGYAGPRDKCNIYYPSKDIVGPGISPLRNVDNTNIDIAKIQSNILTINYAGDPKKIKIIVFSKDSAGRDLMDNTEFLGEAFVTNEREWKFVINDEKPLPNMVMAIAVYKDRLEMEKYEQIHDREYLSLDLEHVANLQ